MDLINDNNSQLVFCFVLRVVVDGNANGTLIPIGLFLTFYLHLGHYDLDIQIANEKLL